MDPTEPTQSVDGPQPLCALCKRPIVSLDKKVVSLTVGRAEVFDWDERLFRETQDFDFCDLTHLNEYLASNPISDTWENSEIDDRPLGLLGGVIVCFVLAILLAALITGFIVGGSGLWRLLT